MASSNFLKENQEFWKAIFLHTNLSQKLMETNSVLSNIYFELPDYGKVEIAAKPAVPLGTNFMSDVFTVNASCGGDKVYTGFVKVLPSNPSRLAAGFIGGSYERETVVYQQWLPELNEIRSSKHLTNLDVPLSVADAYFVNLVFSEDRSTLEKETVYVLEDLKSKGYRMSASARTATGIDSKHVEIALKTYANYHALSIANLRRYKSNDGGKGSSYNFPPSYEIFLKDHNYINPAGVYRTIVLPSYSKILRHFHQNEAADWLDGLLPELERIWDWKSSFDSGTLSCLLHGDAWNNNVLFRYPENSEQPEEMLLIDWQMSRVGHPFHDLGYFLFSSTSSAFRRKHLERMINEYYTNLSSALSKLSINLDKEGYDREKFMEEVKERYILMMMIALFILPILLDSSKATEHTLKNQDISKDLNTTNTGDVKQEEQLDEQGTKRGWESLFDLDSVAANPILSQRVIELIVDVKEMSSKITSDWYDSDYI